MTAQVKRYGPIGYTWPELVAFASNQGCWKSHSNRNIAANFIRGMFDRNELTIQEFGFLFLLLTMRGI